MRRDTGDPPPAQRKGRPAPDQGKRAHSWDYVTRGNYLAQISLHRVDPGVDLQHSLCINMAALPGGLPRANDVAYDAVPRIFERCCKCLGDTYECSKHSPKQVLDWDWCHKCSHMAHIVCMAVYEDAWPSLRNNCICIHCVTREEDPPRKYLCIPCNSDDEQVRSQGWHICGKKSQAKFSNTGNAAASEKSKKQTCCWPEPPSSEGEPLGR